jgi:uncharacterized damage-inducible protein DinB
MKNHFQQMFQCDYWAMTRLGAAMSDLQEVPERVLSLYAHLLATQHVWQCRIMDVPYTMNAWPEIQRKDWQATLQRNQELILPFLENLSEEDLEKVVSYKNSAGISYSNSVGDILTHVITHANYHMGQINILLKPVLQPLPDLSYITYRREINSV